MANDKIFLRCRGCDALLGIYKHFGGPDPTEYITGSELSEYIADHLYCASYGDGRHLHEPSPFECVTDHVLMQRAK